MIARYLVRICGEHLPDQGSDGLVVADGPETQRVDEFADWSPRLHRRLEQPTGGRLADLAAQSRRDHVRNAPGQGGHAVRRVAVRPGRHPPRQLRQGDPALVDVTPEDHHHPVAHALGDGRGRAGSQARVHGAYGALEELEGSGLRREDVRVILRDAVVPHKTPARRAGQLRHRLRHAPEAGPVHLEIDQVRLGEIPVVGQALLRPHGHGAPTRIVPEKRLVHDRPPVPDDAALPVDLKGERPSDRPEGVEVLDLGLRAQRRRALRPDGDVGVEAQAPLVHLPRRDAQVDQDPPEFAQKRVGRINAPYIRTRHDLDQRHAAAVHVDQAAAGSVVFKVDALACVLLYVDLPNAHAPDLPPNLHVKMPAGGQGLRVLSDLIALGQVGVEVVLAGEARARRDRRTKRERDRRRGVHDGPVEHGQRSRHAQTDGARARIRRASGGVQASAENLGARRELRVHLEAYDGFELQRDPLRPGWTERRTRGTLVRPRHAEHD